MRDSVVGGWNLSQYKAGIIYTEYVAGEIKAQL